ncbi:DsbA family protein [Haloechinothrix sp. LS1_15]|uniref:mycothiol-dependent nitroreductase Rv2466c family protein n=1 Tax=Haloechinothrix sp. LS1_15 TaxID=2652248 RepID=UPI002946AB6B|nr:DsbA family protein [Haloechinothrix sp. LS1_15]MDV6013610.1 hypothetical protein [Haloechinothrix sp. LS1_15]
MADVDLEFSFDPVCPFCWVTAEWVWHVVERRSLRVRWRPLSLRILNEPIGYQDRPEGYPQAHQRGLEMLRVVATARQQHGPEVVGELYRAMGRALWHTPEPSVDGFEAILAECARPRDLTAILGEVGLPRELATAAADAGWDEVLRADTEEAVERAGGEVGTPILSFDPPDGPAFFGPVIDRAPEGDDALRLWDSITTLARWPGFAELKRGLRAFPHTPLTAHLSGRATRVR